MSSHPAFLIAAFDFVVGVLLARYFLLGRIHHRKMRLPLSWAVIICLVNASGTFCDFTVVQATTFLGGLGMVNILAAAIRAEEPRAPSPPTQASGPYV